MRKCRAIRIKDHLEIVRVSHSITEAEKPWIFGTASTFLGAENLSRCTDEQNPGTT
jgi:hypothetical protein